MGTAGGPPRAGHRGSAAGIGGPDRFFATLRTAGMTLNATVPLPDHYSYAKSPLRIGQDRADPGNREGCGEMQRAGRRAPVGRAGHAPRFRSRVLRPRGRPPADPAMRGRPLRPGCRKRKKKKNSTKIRSWNPACSTFSSARSARLPPVRPPATPELICSCRPPGLPAARRHPDHAGKRSAHRLTPSALADAP